MHVGPYKGTHVCNTTMAKGVQPDMGSHVDVDTCIGACQHSNQSVGPKER